MVLKELQSLTGHTGRVWNCSWNPKGSLLATSGEDTHIRLWGKEGDQWVTKTILSEGHTRTVRNVAWSACGNYIAAASFDGTVSIWDRKNGQFECNATLEGHENEVKAAAWAKSGNFLATCSRDKSVWVWDVDQDEDEYMCASVLQAHTQDVKRVKWHPLEDTLASCSYDNRLKLFKEDDDDWVCVSTLSSHDSSVWSFAFNNDGSRIASCSEDETIKIWQEFKPGNEQGIKTPGKDSAWKCVCTLSGYFSRPIYDIDWCAQSGFIVAAGGDNSIQVFKESDTSQDINAPEFEKVLTQSEAHSEDVNCVSWNPTERGLLASCSDDGDVKLWTLTDC
ncbi:hypothetical protein TCAL_05936 [Tigriopus californicus]|uniref:Probable cytosolic iron-sulfur protein assembly protein Ciao1 n=1 Tax=Tigriopus californicus TaxID=6832 RepID=A0A553P0N4_TIGCA|nr:probable cytosolic iron-sulfur protein assembly protein Ciao1 [Tigriopus californicus]XP_059090901.1 probable cytosolic iron-sulfur protein assembly protein Ciao1 [Tigriopus californicus]TRY71162.1 hypothetical protein TCAL_05936 [Tigriopus californicus]|eukprot:TCALIF_05936-PA protein Name:"Similar to Ciao1 Probable cytosolic iron-sulfur protein assembly protein Ciao1 (Aedes aegypti)" AED:0.27 eAED:0.27 QI:0/-1/0/1/-1/1/1/0/335